MEKPNSGQLIKSSANQINIFEIFLGGLDQHSKEEEIYSILSQHAQILRIELKRRKKNKKSKCLGYGKLTTD
jgi:RNA recognition motif-containing protein